MNDYTLPSWLNKLRQNEIVSRVRDDPRTTEDNILGITMAEAREVIGAGKANFDHPSGGFSAEERVLLYAYLNQLRHLEELIEIFRQIFTKKLTEKMTVIDLGCGPFTGGLAFACVPGPKFDYIGLDQSREMRKLGNQLASTVARTEDVPKFDNIWWTDDLQSFSNEWNIAPNWNPIFVIVSYLFASSTLNVKKLVQDLDRLLNRLGNGSVTVLYTNSPSEEHNTKFESFTEKLGELGFQQHANDVGAIEISRSYVEKEHELRYALFHRNKREILHL